MPREDEDPIPALERQLAEQVVGRLGGWSPLDAADFLGTDQPRISELRHGRLQRFSFEQLVRMSREWMVRCASASRGARAARRCSRQLGSVLRVMRDA